MMKVTGLRYFVFLKLVHVFLLCALARPSQQQAVCNNPTVLLSQSQIMVSGFAANDQELEKLRHDTGEGLCIPSDQTPKTITVNFQTSFQARAVLTGISIQLSKNWNTTHGFVKTYRMRYENTSGTTLDFPGGLYNGPSKPGISKNNFERSDFHSSIYKVMNKLFIDIEEFDNTQKNICLRIEVYGCPAGICNSPCQHGGKCKNDDDCECTANYGSSSTQCQYYYPSMVANPTITVVDDGTGNNSVKFQCNIIDKRNEVKHTAKWILDGQPVTPKIKPKPEESSVIMISELLQRDLYNQPMIKKHLKCEVTACWSNCGVADSPSRSSEKLTPTVKVITPFPPSMTLVEGAKDGEIVSITLGGPPILFLDPSYAVAHGTTDVRLEAQFDLNEKSYTCATVPIVVANKPKEQSKGANPSCGPPLTSKNWHEPHKIQVKAVMDGLYTQVTMKRKLHIAIKHIDSKGMYVYANKLKLPNGSNAEVDVDVKNADGWGVLDNRNALHVVGSVCYSLNDPHMATFDGLKYEAQIVGEFVAYRHKEHNVQVNGYFQDCKKAANLWLGATCNCGVAIKVEDEVIVFSSCTTTRIPSFEDSNVTKKKKKGHFFNAYMFLHEDKGTLNDKLPSGTRVYATSDGMAYFVYLPSGTYIKVMAETVGGTNHWLTTSVINFIIVPSVSDREQSDGFCGHYDGNAAHPGDLRHPNGNIYTGSIHSHMEVWREKCSLFYGTAKVNTSADVKMYCRCVLDSHTYDCGENYDADPCLPSDGTVTEVTADLINDFSYKPGAEACTHIQRRKRRDVYDFPDHEFHHLSKRAVGTSPDEEDDVYLSIIFNASYVSKNPSWPTESGWTLAKAKTFCEDYLLNKDSVKNCKVFLGTSFDSKIENCIFDIKLTDGTNFAESTLKNIISQCFSAAEKFPPDVTTLPGGMKRTELYDSLCLNNCNYKGVCKNGMCVCNSGFYGGGCSLTKDKPPIISYVSRDGLCNVRSRNCTRSEIFGTGHIKSTDLKCRITPYNPVTGVRYDKQQFTTPARYINFNMLLCPHNGTNGTYLIAVSNNNGKDYSKDELLFMAYDSVCFTCSIDQEEKKGNCTQLRTGCAVGSGCYKPGELDPTEKCNICYPSQNISQWSRNAGDPNCPLDNTIAIIAGVTSAVLVIIIIIVIAVVTHKNCRRKKLGAVSPSTEDIRDKVEEDRPN